MSAVEVNFDGLIGPTHNYAGLSHGNVASAGSKSSISHPRAAALEGLAKMKRLMELGVKQAVLPPHVRPDLAMLRRCGFTGSDADVIESAWQGDRVLLASCYSASSMWAANAATISPSPDTRDGKLHLTPANLIGTLHRSIEAATTQADLRRILPDDAHFMVHDPLPPPLADEGAANHTRLCTAHDQPGVEIFTFGRSITDPSLPAPRRYPARHTREASEAIARLHGVQNALFVQQHPAAIDAGVFHNDVAAVGHRNLLFIHQRAWVEQDRALAQLRELVPGLQIIEIGELDLPLQEAVSTYLFNSQIIDRADGSMLLVAPNECRASDRARRVIERIIAADNPITVAEYVTVNQSMRNGGGPACLRLRVAMSGAQLAAMHLGVFPTDSLYEELTNCVRLRYRETLASEELRDPRLIEESRAAVEEIRAILGLA